MQIFNLYDTIILFYNNKTHFVHNILVTVQHALRTFTMLRTERDGFAVEFGLQNIVNVRNQVALPLMHEA